MSTRAKNALQALIALHNDEEQDPQQALTNLLIDLSYHSQSTHTNLTMAAWHANHHCNQHPISHLETKEILRIAQ